MNFGIISKFVFHLQSMPKNVDFLFPRLVLTFSAFESGFFPSAKFILLGNQLMYTVFLQ